MKSEEKDVVVASVVAPRRDHGLVLRGVSYARDASLPVVATKLRQNQTSCNATAAEVRPAIAIVLTAMPKLSHMSF
ncbi:unnamed protein product [Sphagnum balticum]